MLKLIPVFSFALLVASCISAPPPSNTPAPVSQFRPIEITTAMKAGITSSRPFEVVYALEYATNRTDKSVPETFGGLSSMLFASKPVSKLQFEVISDQGHFGVLEVPDAMVSAADLAPKLIGTSPVVMVPLRGPDGALLSGGNNVDSEGLARTPDGRMVSLERNHRLLRLSDASVFRGQASSAGPNLIGFEGLEPNGGMEALVALPDGRFLASAEYGRGDQGPEAKLKAPFWIFGLNQAGPIAPLGTFQNSGGYGVTEARVMDGDLWLLKREYDPATQINKARLERCPLASVVSGAPVCTLEMTLEPPFVMDNYEGMEIFKQAGTGDLYFYILSDDNFSATQRTILLAFKLPR
jgi:hypothetical protein